MAAVSEARATAERPTVIILRETVRESIVSDLGTFAMFAGLIGLGWMVGSAALQYAGAAIGVVFIVGRTMALAAKEEMTVEQARAKLDEIEAKANGKGGAL